jgi:3,4-dihydroxy 2-butanone 4-phosphate synthase/GTP cyclohydrolase II
MSAILPAETETLFHSIPEALEDLRGGRMVIVVDDENRETKGISSVLPSLPRQR